VRAAYLAQSVALAAKEAIRTRATQDVLLPSHTEEAD